MGILGSGKVPKLIVFIVKIWWLCLGFPHNTHIVVPPYTSFSFPTHTYIRTQSYILILIFDRWFNQMFYLNYSLILIVTPFPCCHPLMYMALMLIYAQSQLLESFSVSLYSYAHAMYTLYLEENMNSYFAFFFFKMKSDISLVLPTVPLENDSGITISNIRFCLMIIWKIFL